MWRTVGNNGWNSRVEVPGGNHGRLGGQPCILLAVAPRNTHVWCKELYVQAIRLLSGRSVPSRGKVAWGEPVRLLQWPSDSNPRHQEEDTLCKPGQT